MRLPQAEVFGFDARRRFAIQRLLQVRLLRIRQPFRVRGPVDDDFQGDESEQDRRQAFDDEQPAPAGIAHGAVEQFQDQPAERGGDGVVERTDDQEQAEYAPAVLRRKPQRQVVDHTGKEAGLRDAEQEAGDEKAGFATDETHRDRHDPPRHHDAGKPDARADLGQDQVARHFADEVADEKKPGTPAEHRGREPQIGVHRQRRQADVEPVDDADQVGQQQERQHAPRHLAHERLFFDLRHVHSPIFVITSIFTTEAQRTRRKAIWELTIRTSGKGQSVGDLLDSI